jgi:hypothetical protein
VEENHQVTDEYVFNICAMFTHEYETWTLIYLMALFSLFDRLMKVANVIMWPRGEGVTQARESNNVQTQTPQKHTDLNLMQFFYL